LRIVGLNQLQMRHLAKALRDQALVGSRHRSFVVGIARIARRFQSLDEFCLRRAGGFGCLLLLGKHGRQESQGKALQKKNENESESGLSFLLRLPVRFS